MFDFTLLATDGAARASSFTTPHGVVQTPLFMPVGTHGAVKGVAPVELTIIGSQIVLANTYHLHLRPGEQVVQKVGGLHEFTGYPGPMLTDSGGFQVFSLGERGGDGTTKTALRKVDEHGITFTSHLDGSRHVMSPEDSIAVQQALGADIIMAFDQPVYGMSQASEAEAAMQRTQRWLERSIGQWQRGVPERQALFGIVQGGVHAALHKQSAAFTVGQDLPGVAIGGLSVGESKTEMWAALASIIAELPVDRPRYFMGLGEPLDLLHAVALGVDMMDCVAPSRLARHGAVWVFSGEVEVLEAFYRGDTMTLLQLGKPLRLQRINLKRAEFADDPRPLLAEISGESRERWVPDQVAQFPRASLRHYLHSGEVLGSRVLTLHNIRMLHALAAHARAAVLQGAFTRLLSLFQY